MEKKPTESFDTKIQEENYKSTFSQSMKISFFFFLIFLIVLFQSVNTEGLIRTFVLAPLNSKANCPFQTDKLKLSAFPPSVSIKKLTLSRMCLRTKENIELKDVNVSLSTPTFLPLGIRAYTEFKFENSHIKAYPALIYDGSVLTKVVKSTINSEDIKKFAPKLTFLKGKLSLEGKLRASKSYFESGDLSIKSNDIRIAKGDITTPIGMPLTIPSIPLNNLKASITIKNNRVQFQEFILGDQDSPLIAQITGNIKVVPQRLTNSELNLGVKFKSTSELEAIIPIGTFFENNKNKQTGFYELSVGGNFFKPQLNKSDL